MRDCLLLEYNTRRARHAEAARVRIYFEDGENFCLWMSEKDAIANIKEKLLDEKEMRKVIAAYHGNFKMADLVQSSDHPHLYIRKQEAPHA